MGGGLFGACHLFCFPLLGFALLLLFSSRSTLCVADECCFLFHRKGSTRLGRPQGRAYGWAGKSPHLRFALLLFRSYFPPKPCVCLCLATCVLLEKRNQHTPIFERIKKNVTMDKQIVNTTSSMSRKGDSSSSHYRIKSGAGASERAVATKQY